MAVAPWREQFRKDAQNRWDGTYKGVPFRVDSHSLESGRRIVDHVFPYRDMAYTEDLGRKQRQFSLDVYVIGEDYFPARDALIEALESEGAGVLVHPYLGTKTVECVSFTLSESKAEGGFAKFSISFHETGRAPAPDLLLDPISDVAAAATSVDESLVNDMAGFDVSLLSEFSLARAVAMVDSATDTIQRIANSFPGNFGIAELGYSIRVLKQTTADLIRRPLVLAETTKDAFQTLLGAINPQGLNPLEEDRPDAEEKSLIQGRTQREAFRSAINLTPAAPPPEGATPSRIQEAKNERLFKNLIKGSAVSKLALVSVQTTYATFNEAIETRDYIVSEIEAIMEDPEISDDSYAAFADLKATVIQGIPNGISEEARLSRVSLTQVMPSLVTTYELYGNLVLEQDLILRNKIKNPAFIPAGEIEVIAGG